jgi:hypothetical protein
MPCRHRKNLSVLVRFSGNEGEVIATRIASVRCANDRG